MRIIAGEWRGRKLVAPPGDLTRPTADRTRETLFNMLASRIGSFEGLAVLDLFAHDAEVLASDRTYRGHDEIAAWLAAGFEADGPGLLGQLWPGGA